MKDVGNRPSVDGLNDEMIKDVVHIAASEIRERIGSSLVEVRLFGSCARGDYSKESDIDIALLVTDDYSECNRYIDDMASVATHIAMEYFAVVNFVCIPYSDYVKKKTSYSLYKNIDQEGITIKIDG